MSQERNLLRFSISVALSLVAILMPAAVSAQADCCVGRVGDANASGDDEPTIGDACFMIGVTMGFFPVPTDFCYAEGDVNQSGGANPALDDISIGDIAMLIDYLFITGPSMSLGGCLQGAPVGSLIGVSECKAVEATAYSTQTCLAYEYDPVHSVLRLRQIDAALNCCPVTALTANVLGDTIFISEVDSGLCDCNCLYDLEFEIANLPNHSWRIAVLEAIPGEGTTLDFQADLPHSLSGQVCVERTSYPWGAPPGGELLDRSECGGWDAAASKSSTLSTSSPERDSACVDLTYGADGTLEIVHTAAGANCCIDSISVRFVIQGADITVVETEHLYGGGCDCICNYDLKMIMMELPARVYHFRFDEAWGRPVIEFTVDLSTQKTYHVCVPRN